MTITISNLRNNLKEILQSVQGGKKVEITQRGKIIALINPPPVDSIELEQEIQYLRSNIRIGDIVSSLKEQDWTFDKKNIVRRNKK